MPTAAADAHARRVASALTRGKNLGCLPLHGPDVAPEFGAPKLRGAVSLAVASGIDLFGWQVWALAHGLESDPGSGLHRHRHVAVVVPRQAGKTWVGHARMLYGLARGERMAYTAQRRWMARQRWDDFVEGWLPVIGDRVDAVRRGAGTEEVRMRPLPGQRHAGFLKIVTPDADGPRGMTLDAVVADESYAHDMEFHGAVSATMATRPGAQLWMLSNAGDHSSEMLLHFRELGHAPGSAGVCWMEWAAAETADAADEDTWFTAIPSLGLLGGPTVEALRGYQQTMTAESFDREFLNRWPLAGPGGVIDPMRWAALGSAEIDHDPDTLTVAAAVHRDRGHAAVASASIRDGKLLVEVIETRDSAPTWVAPKLIELARRHRAAIAVDVHGGTGTVAEELAAAKAPFVDVRTGSYARACGMLYDRIQTRTLAHYSDPRLDAAVAGAGRRRLAGAWAWAETTDAPVTVLEAVTVAAYGAATRPEKRRPGVYWQRTPDDGGGGG